MSKKPIWISGYSRLFVAIGEQRLYVHDVRDFVVNIKPRDIILSLMLPFGLEFYNDLRKCDAYYVLTSDHGRPDVFVEEIITLHVVKPFIQYASLNSLLASSMDDLEPSYLELSVGYEELHYKDVLI